MVTRPRTTLREVLRSNDAAIVEAHRLLRRAFHETEMVSRTEWRNSLREREAGVWSDSRWHLVVGELRGKVVGVASGTYLGNVNTGVVGYLAVSSDARGLGLGPKLRARLRAIFVRDALEIRDKMLDAVLGEVRHDNPWLRTLARRDRIVALDFDYFQPQLRHGGRPVPLVLYYESMDRNRTRVSTALIRKLLFTLWRRIYRVPRPMSRAAFRRMLAQLEGRRSIGKLTPGEATKLAKRSR